MPISGERILALNAVFGQPRFGEARGKERAQNAAKEAMFRGYLGEIPLKTAKRVIYFVSGGNITMTEMVEAEGLIHDGQVFMTLFHADFTNGDVRQAFNDWLGIAPGQVSFLDVL